MLSRLFRAVDLFRREASESLSDNSSGGAVGSARHNRSTASETSGAGTGALCWKQYAYQAQESTHGKQEQQVRQEQQEPQETRAHQARHVRPV